MGPGTTLILVGSPWSDEHGRALNFSPVLPGTACLVDAAQIIPIGQVDQLALGARGLARGTPNENPKGRREEHGGQHGSELPR